MTEPGPEDHPHRPNLHRLLRERLPALGLDVDMYGPYVWGDDEDGALDSDDDDDGDALRDVVLGVLQASSETHSDDEAAWIDLLEKIAEANKLDAGLRREAREQHLRETKTKMEEDLARAKLEEKEKADVEKEEKKKSSHVDEETKRRLMQQYGYDEPAEDEAASGPAASGGGGKGKAKASGAVSNKDLARAAHAEKTKEIRNANKTTKAEERKKTKEQKASKADLKEARRKRAQKGERRA